jgi:hypothetical protein
MCDTNGSCPTTTLVTVDWYRTFTATAGVVTYFGARPVLCDSVPGGSISMATSPVVSQPEVVAVLVRGPRTHVGAALRQGHDRSLQESIRPSRDTPFLYNDLTWGP